MSRLHAPSTERNRDLILPILRRILPDSGVVLEIASGSGQHAIHFGRNLSHLLWQPTDPDPAALASITAWNRLMGPGNVLAPLQLDVREASWPVARADAMVCINMLHISPWESTPGLLAGAGRLLPVGGVLYLYGPYKREGRHTAPSNEAFDIWLKQRDPRFGVRDLETVCAEAEACGLVLEEEIAMPANNFSLVLRRR